jgi:putative glutathione S-transferase
MIKRSYEMGRLVDGVWIDTTIITSNKKGEYDRQPRGFREVISHDHPVYKPESGRYHLYISYACPWAHRTLIYRKLKGLEDHITVSVVSPDMLDHGWSFDTSLAGSTGDALHSKAHLFEIYQLAQSDVSTSVTVPILWDKKTNSIVNNESSEIIRIFNTAFNELTKNYTDYYPEELKAEIDTVNTNVYGDINNGVYKSGFALNQETYESAVTKLFNRLDELDKVLAEKKYLLGDKLTEADLRLVPTLLRFDIVYFGHFKCNLKLIRDYKNLSRYLKELYLIPAINETTNFEHIKRHYYFSHESINPYRIVPVGPASII